MTSAKLMNYRSKICPICGKEFLPTTSRQKYCRTLVTTTCKVCGDSYSYTCGSQNVETCSKSECKNAYAHQRSVQHFHGTTLVCAWPGCNTVFHPVNSKQKYCKERHYRDCVICGKRFEVDLSKNAADIPETCSKECSIQLRFRNGNPFQNPESRDRAKQTCLKKYGVEHPSQSSEVQKKMSSSYFLKTGYTHPSHDPEVRSKSAKSVTHLSKFEQRIANIFSEYNIDYVWHYMINSESLSHEFDFYIPKYKILVDCDGVYYHSYLSDPDGKHVLDCYDEDRLALVPEDHIFHVIVEGHEESGIAYLVKLMNSIDNNTFNYEGELFTWCRSIEFPYPEFQDDRLRTDFNRLCNYSTEKYTPNARLGDSIIQKFHRSIYDCHVGQYPSPVEAWYDDNMLRRVIANRLIYQNDVDPFKILKGFNISKICPRVSVFNPVLARYLIQKYLNEFNQIFDPFSGFSGRLLGAASCNKTYIGQDLNTTAVGESSQIIEFLNLNNCTVVQQDILNSSGSYECLLTCPPYDKKEIYSSETVFKSCDDWIDEILSRFRCKKYVFVVDETTKYLDHVQEEIRSASHLVNITERVVVI